MGKISFLPPQMDGTLATTAPKAHSGPMSMLLDDAMAFIYQIPSMPMMTLPWKTTNRFAELHPTTMNIRDWLLHMILMAVEMMVLCCAAPAFMFLPGSVFMVMCALCCAGIWAMCMPLMGQRVVRSTIEIPHAIRAENMESERWVCVSGYCASNNWLRANCDRLALTFGRPVTGIHNTTHGYIADVLEDMFQHATRNMGTCGRTTYDVLKKYALDPKVTKVVVVAHSQGASITSMVLDQLCTDLPPEMLRKIEVYTFGSTARTFSNPPLSLPTYQSAKTNTSTEPRRLIPHIEHYANEHDCASRAGVLRAVSQCPRTTYHGRVFMRAGASGSFLNMHYLDAMFPLLPAVPPSKNQQGEQDEVSFLDEIVHVEEDIAFRREAADCAAVMEESTTMGGGRKSMNGPKINFVGVAKQAAEGCKGKSVRELSRLAKYMYGQRPLVDPDASVNGLQGGGMMSEMAGKGRKG